MQATDHGQDFGVFWFFFVFFLLINSNFIFIMFSKIFIYLTALSLSCNP